jgi:hypothetical protein
MQLGLSRVYFARESSNGCGATNARFARPGGLHGERLAHNGAATSNGLQVGHCAATRGGMATGGGGGGGEGAQSGW